MLVIELKKHNYWDLPSVSNLELIIVIIKEAGQGCDTLSLSLNSTNFKNISANET
jgi:hypothetical protein